MNSLLLAYCLLLLAGVIWIVYRAAVYMRTEREREARVTELFEDEDFKKYLKDLSVESKTAGERPEPAADRAGPAAGTPRVPRPGLPPQQKTPAPPRGPVLQPKPKQRPDTGPHTDRTPQQPKPQPRSTDRRPARRDS